MTRMKAYLGMKKKKHLVMKKLPKTNLNIIIIHNVQRYLILSNVAKIEGEEIVALTWKHPVGNCC